MTNNTPDTLDALDKKEHSFAQKEILELTGGEFIGQFESSHLNMGLTETVVRKKTDVIQSEDEKPFYYSVPLGNHSKFLKSEEAIKIARSHFTKEIIECLNWISNNHTANSPDGIAGFQKLFATINEYTNKSLKDPFASLLLAIYQGLVYEENWTSLDPKVYSAVSKILKGFNNRHHIGLDDIDNALIKLEKMGINPTPF